MKKLPKKSTIKNKLDKLVGDYFRNKRCCAAKGSYVNCAGRIEWAHIHSRRYLSTRWSLDNAKNLCSAHHFYFTHNPTHFVQWLKKTDPDGYERNEQDFRTVRPMGVVEMMELYENLKKRIG